VEIVVETLSGERGLVVICHADHAQDSCSFNVTREQALKLHDDIYDALGQIKEAPPMDGSCPFEVDQLKLQLENQIAHSESLSEALLELRRKLRNLLSETEDHKFGV
jgi:hypothetical protein